MTWRPIPGLPHHECDAAGQIRSLDRYVRCSDGVTMLVRGRILKQGKGSMVSINGYPRSARLLYAKAFPHSRT